MTIETLLCHLGHPKAIPNNEGLARALKAMYDSLTAAAGEGAYVTRADLARHFGVGDLRIATALHKARITGIKTGRITRYPRETTIAAIVPYLTGTLKPLTA